MSNDAQSYLYFGLSLAGLAAALYFAARDTSTLSRVALAGVAVGGYAAGTTGYSAFLTATHPTPNTITDLTRPGAL